MGRETMPTPMNIEASIHDMTLDEWKGLALRVSIQLGRRPGTDGPDDAGSGMLRDVAEMKNAIGRPPSLKDGQLDEGSGLSKMLVEHHRTSARSRATSLGAVVIAVAGAVVTLANQYAAHAAPPSVPVPVPIAVPAPAR
jgi:hypothetical protein